jgi:CRP/FNR family transcriptional regulator
MKNFEKITTFFSKCKQLHFKKGEIIIRAGDASSGVYFLESGYVKVYSITESGDENLHFILKPHEPFPLEETFTNTDENLYYEAMNSVQVKKSSRDDFLAFTKERSKNSLELLSAVIGMLEMYRSRVNNLELTNAQARIISRLLFLAERFGKEKDNRVTFDLPITQKDVANAINVTRETANREINKLIKKRIIRWRNQKMVILDKEKLKGELLLYFERKAL